MTEHVIDANVFIHAVQQSLSDRFPDPITVPRVMDELESRGAKTRAQQSDVSVFEPSVESRNAVQNVVNDQNEVLSPADIDVIALARDRDAVVVSDDYGVQNVAAVMKVQYRGASQDPITQRITWQYRCTGCGERFTELEPDQSCPRCGNKLKRVPADRDGVE